MNPKELLISGLQELGLEPSDEAVRGFMLYLDELMKWNRAYSLTSIFDEQGIVVKHFLDSCLYIKCLPEGTGFIADIGSGAGFPGLPIKILMPEVRVVLVEPVGKKAAFLRNVIRKLGLKGVEVLPQRVQELKGVQVDVALTRALFTVSEFYKAARHIVRPGGVMVMSKGPGLEDELAKAPPLRIRDMTLPHDGAVRKMVMIEVAPFT